jgi:hypothetical protein
MRIGTRLPISAATAAESQSFLRVRCDVPPSSSRGRELFFRPGFRASKLRRLSLGVMPCFNSCVRRVTPVLAFACAGCSNVLGADFDRNEGPAATLTVELAAHPRDGAESFPLTGSGTVVSSDGKIDCEARCNAAYLLDDAVSVTLVATPAEGSAFAGWQAPGCEASRAPTCIVELARDVSAQAYFVKNGANLWGVGLTESGLNTGVAIRAAANGDSYAVGTFEGSLSLPSLTLENEGRDDLYLLHLNAQGELVSSGPGQAPARTIGSTFSDGARGLALSSSGPIVIGGSSPEGTAAILHPLGDDIQGAASAFVAAFDFDLGLRWHHVGRGTGLLDFSFVEVSPKDGSTRILGFSNGELKVGELEATSTNGTQMFLLTIDVNGVPKSLELMDAENGLALSSLGQETDYLIAGHPLRWGAQFAGCAPPAFFDFNFVMRRKADGTCVDILGFSDRFVLQQVMVGRQDHVYLLGHLQQGSLELDPVDPKAHVDADANGMFLLIQLSSHLKWEAGKSWIQTISGTSKLASGGAGAEIVLSLIAGGDMFVGPERTLVPYQTQQGMTFLGFDLTGAFLWERSFGNVGTSAVNQLSWHEPSSTWFIAADAGPVDVHPEQPLSFDLENVTQPPIVLDERDSVFARFAP